jgi:glycosyltransferase involved in cell wall biosynthesis
MIMKICMIAPQPPPYGGIANWFLTVKKYFEKKNEFAFDYINIAPSTRTTEGRTLWNRVTDGGIEMIVHRKKLKLIVKKSAPDVIHMTTSGQLAIIRDILLLKYAKKKKIPTVYHIHFGRIPKIKKNNSFEWKLIKKAMSIANCSIVIDETTHSVLKSEKSINRLEYVPNPFDLKLCNKLAYANKEKVIIFVGWVIKSKGIEELLCAWKNIHSEYPMYELIMVGPYEEEYKKYLIEKYPLPRVCFCGELPHLDTLHLIQTAHLFVLPSYTEGFPNVVLEAMALETPIVSTDVGAIPTMLDDCGFVVRSQNSKELEDAIRNCLMSDSLSEVTCKAKNRVHKLYSSDIVCEQYADIWKSLCDSKT